MVEGNFQRLGDEVTFREVVVGQPRVERIPAELLFDNLVYRMTASMQSLNLMAEREHVVQLVLKWLATFLNDAAVGAANNVKFIGEDGLD